MKKILLTTAAAAVIATSSAYAAQDGFYVKAQAGISRFDGFKLGDELSGEDVENKYKVKNTGVIGIAAGYYLMKNIRFEVAFDHFFEPTFKMPTNKDLNLGWGQDGKALQVLKDVYDSKFKVKVDTLMFNGFVDVCDADMVKLFVGAGFGVAQVKAKMIETRVDKIASRENGKEPTDATLKEITTKLKKKTNAAFALYVGAAYEVADGINAELTYSYKNMGKMSKTNGHPELKSHNFGVGVRFDI